MKSYIGIVPEKTLKEAMQKLDVTAEKILIVVDANDRLLGCLSDGDIRRSILSGNPLENKIEDAYNPNPVIAREGSSIDELKRLMLENKIEVVPIVNEDNKLVDYKVWEDVFDDDVKRAAVSEKISIPLVVMAGGKGTRLDPFTRVLPKPLIPIGNKTIVERIIDKFAEYGINEFYFTLNHMSKIIRAYFEELKLEISYTFVEEDEPLGTAGSLKLVTNLINTDFLVTNCDIMIEADYSDLYKHHKQNGYAITLVASAKNYRIPYGICEIENGGKLARIKEKPKFDFLVNTGLYVINPGVLDLIPTNEYFDMTDLIQAVKNSGRDIGVYPVSESAWIDIGEWSEYKKSLEAFKNV